MVNDDYKRMSDTHNIIIESRERLSISGVTEVISFDEQQVVVETTRGLLTVEGQQLHVEKLSLDVGELSVEGMIDAVVYAAERQQKGFWSRIF